MSTGFMERFKGKIKVAKLLIDSGSANGVFVNGVANGYIRQPNVWTNAGAPTSGGSGTLNGVALAGDVLVDTTNKNIYINTNTSASPTWTLLTLAGSSPTLAGIGSSIPWQVYNAVSTAPTANVLALTGANICGGMTETWLNLTAALSAGAAADLPTVAALITAMTAAGLNPVAGGSYILNLMNTSSGNFSWTITTATGWTLTGTMTVAQNTYRKCLITLGAGLTSATLQSLGEYAITAGV